MRLYGSRGMHDRLVPSPQDPHGWLRREDNHLLVVERSPLDVLCRCPFTACQTDLAPIKRKPNIRVGESLMATYEEKLKQFALTDDLPRLNAGQAVGVGLWVAATVDEPLGVALVATASQPLGVGGTSVVAGTLAGAAAMVMKMAEAADAKDPHATNTPRGQQADVERVQPAQQR